MKTKTHERLEVERGNRHRTFRTDVLQKTQVELAADLDKGQSTIANLDKGQDIPAECKTYYTRRGLNWNWYYTGQGLKLVNSAPKGEGDVPYSNMSSRISPMDPGAVNDGLDHFFDMMKDQMDNYRYVVDAPHYSQEERTDLYQRLYKRILKEVQILEESF